MVVAGEIIQHLPNPGMFLRSVRSVLRPEARVVITTINAYCLRRFVRLPFGIESVHCDHVAYYSHQTLRRLCEMHGYSVLDQLSYRLPNRRPLLPYFVERLACMISPNLGEGIISTIQPQNETIA